MITDGQPHSSEALEDILECLEKLADKPQAAPVVNVTAPAPPVTVNVPDHKPCIPVAYTIHITARDREGRISSATLTPVTK